MTFFERSYCKRRLASLTRQARAILNLADGEVDPRYTKILRVNDSGVSWGYSSAQKLSRVDRRRSEPCLEEYLIARRERKIQKYRSPGEWSKSKWVRLYDDERDACFLEDALSKGSFSHGKYRYSLERDMLEKYMDAFEIHQLYLNRKARRRLIVISGLDDHYVEKLREIRLAEMHWRELWGPYPWHTPWLEMLARYI